MSDKNDFPKKTRPVRENLNSKEAAIAVIRAAAERWPSTFIARNSIPQITGGLYTAAYLANCDSAGCGPEGAFRIGRQKCYAVAPLVDWLINRLEV